MNQKKRKKKKKKNEKRRKKKKSLSPLGEKIVLYFKDKKIKRNPVSR